MKNIWLSIALILIALVTSLLGVFKDAFLSGRVPRWVFFTMAILPIMAAALQIYQDVASQKLQKGAHRLISDITPQSDPLLLSTEQQELLMSITNKDRLCEERTTILSGWLDKPGVSAYSVYKKISFFEQGVGSAFSRSTLFSRRGNALTCKQALKN